MNIILNDHKSKQGCFTPPLVYYGIHFAQKNHLVYFSKVPTYFKLECKTKCDMELVKGETFFVPTTFPLAIKNNCKVNRNQPKDTLNIKSINRLLMQHCY